MYIYTTTSSTRIHILPTKWRVKENQVSVCVSNMYSQFILNYDFLFQKLCCHTRKSRFKIIFHLTSCTCHYLCIYTLPSIGGGKGEPGCCVWVKQGSTNYPKLWFPSPTALFSSPPICDLCLCFRHIHSLSISLHFLSQFLMPPFRLISSLYLTRNCHYMAPPPENSSPVSVSGRDRPGLNHMLPSIPCSIYMTGRLLVA